MRWYGLENNYFKIKSGLIEVISLRYNQRRTPRSISPDLRLRSESDGL